MSRVQPAVLSAFKALKSFETLRQTKYFIKNYNSVGVRFLSCFNNPRRLFSSSTDARVIREGGQSSGGDGLKGEGEGQNQKQSVEVQSAIDLPAEESLQNQTTSSAGPQGSTQCESITSRLRRLSQTSPEDFVPSHSGPDEVARAKLRYKSTLQAYESRFAWNQRNRMRNPNFRPRRNDYDNNDNYDNNYKNTIFGDQQYRRFSSTAQRFKESDSEGIIDRLRRLSVTSERDFQPSEGARKIRDKADAIRNSRDYIDETEFDQKRFRPRNNDRRNSYGHNGGNFRNRNEGYQNRNEGYQNRNEGYQNRNEGYQNRNEDYQNRNDGYRNRREVNQYDDPPENRRRNSWSAGDRDRDYDEPQNYERRLDPTSDPRLTKYFKKDKVPLQPQGYYSEIKSSKDKRESGGDTTSYWKSDVRKEKPKTQNQVAVVEKMKKFKTAPIPQEFVERMAMSVDSAAAAEMESYEDDPFSGIEKSKNIIKEADMDLATLIQGDSDTFGTLSVGSVPAKDVIGTAIQKELLKDEKELGLSALDEPEEGDVTFVSAQRWTMEKLVMRIKELVDENKVKEAVDTLLDALEKGGFHYERKEFVYAYNLCISACARVGYVQMAFKLFNDMKKRGFPPKESTYTSLFNACANSTWDAQNNLERMSRLRVLMTEKGIPLNQINYHAMIKGYGRCGDLETSFAIVDEMITVGQIQPNTETFNMLLQACITNTEDGFRHLIVTWRKMQSMRIRPDIFSYNLLLRAIRECGIQLPESDESRKQIESGEKSRVKSSDDNNVPYLPSVVTDEESNDMLNLICLNESEKALSNIRQYAEDAENVPMTYEEVISALALPQNRLAVLGGLRGLLSQMASDKVGPNMKTINELAQIIPPTDAVDLLMMMKTYKLNPHIDLFNLLIKRCHMSNNDRQARELMRALPQYNLTPNIMTWGVAAIGCRNWLSVQNLLKEIDEAHFTPNISIMGAFMQKACFTCDPQFVLDVMYETKNREVIPDPKFILEMEKYKQTVRNGIINKEMGKPIVPERLGTMLEDFEHFEKGWRKFVIHYKSWLKETKVNVEPNDPWKEEFEQFLKNRTHGTLNNSDDDDSDHENEVHHAKSS